MANPMSNMTLFNNILENIQVEHEHYRYIADPKQGPVRLDKFLMDRIPNKTRNKIQRAIKDGAIRVNTRPSRPSYKVRPDDIITVVLTTPPSSGPVMPENIPIDIFYEDDDVIIVNKPAGMVVHPGIGNYSGTLVNALAYTTKDLPLQNDYLDRPGIVHRIDKGTSGLLVVAKNKESMTKLSKQFFDHSIYRRYYALVWGEPKEDEGTIRTTVGRDPKNRKLMTVYDDPEEGKHAVTHYRVVERMYYVSLIECRLETGRTHQIRVHMKHMGHPLFSDSWYGGATIRKGTVFPKYKKFVDHCFEIMPRQALHAKSLGFIHPRTGEKVILHSELPESFEEVLSRWRAYVNQRRK